MKIIRSIRKWDGWESIEDNMTEQEELEYKKSLVPQELSPRQIRIALIQSWVSLESIDSIIDQLPEPTKSLTRTLREYSLSYSRDDETLIQFASELWFEQEELDLLFALWATL